MDIYLNKEKINYVKSVFNTTLAHEETMEMIVPDALPDILRILDTDANVFLRSKSTDNGRVTVTGIAATTVLYCPENENGVKKMTLEIPFTAMAADPEISPNSRVTASVNLAAADASMINPRKIVVRVEFLTDVACYNDADFQIAAGLDEDNEAGIELMTDNTDIVTTTGVKEKTFVISDELLIPGSNPPLGELLKSRVVLTPEETKVVGSKLILKGNANTTLLYNAAGSNEPNKADFNTEFSQIIELDNPAGDSSFNIILMPTNAYFDGEPTTQNPDGRTVIMEIHAVAQCITQEKKRIAFISDLYSTKYKLEQELVDNAFETRNNVKTSAVFHGLMDTPAHVARVISLNVHTGPVSNMVQGGVLSLRCPLFVNAVYQTDDNRLLSTARHYEVETNADVGENGRFSVTANCGREIFGVAAGNAIELRIPVDFNISQTVERQIRTLSGLSYDETAPLESGNAPSLTLYRLQRGDTMWNLAKRHKTTAKLILNANGLENEENLAAGQLLIIPKKR
jgi:nucleoid-associated protein YgaU